jgi:hypothetical protein
MLENFLFEVWNYSTFVWLALITIATFVIGRLSAASNDKVEIWTLYLCMGFAASVIGWMANQSGRPIQWQQLPSHVAFDRTAGYYPYGDNEVVTFVMRPDQRDSLIPVRFPPNQLPGGKFQLQPGRVMAKFGGSPPTIERL